ncbi:CHAD domain-containing protein [Microbulbifer aggregans]|uniref:CHAD domain-containing protein n=1 Tax=Microbulbifer aggregans TaxID=1769779 RepID=UPI001CFCA713|nr:CHAD domain-containing protein [Microbulbifer aggregans]
MSYELSPRHPVAKNIEEATKHQIKVALHACAHLCRDDAIHQVRKHCKKIRALVRLIRTATPATEQLYRFENAHFRQIAEVLSGSRDPASLHNALTKQLEAKRFPATVALLLARIDTTESDQALAQAQQLLEQGLERIEHWDLQPLRNKDLLRGYTVSYRRAYKAMQAAFAEGDDEHFHTLRKRVKDQWYHSRLMKKRKPRQIGRRCKHLNKLASDLGDWRDLRLLRAFVAFTGDQLDGELIPLLDQAQLRLEQLRESIECGCEQLFACETWQQQRK